jgi:hypothetical protein
MHASSTGFQYPVYTLSGIWSQKQLSQACLKLRKLSLDFHLSSTTSAIICHLSVIGETLHWRPEQSRPDSWRAIHFPHSKTTPNNMLLWKTLETTETPHLSPSSYISHDWPCIPGQKFGVNRELLRRFLAGPDKARSWSVKVPKNQNIQEQWVLILLGQIFRLMHYLFLHSTSPR